MSITVNVPEYDKTLSFPDDFTPEQIQDTIDRDYPVKKVAPTQPGASAGPSTGITSTIGQMEENLVALPGGLYNAFVKPVIELTSGAISNLSKNVKESTSTTSADIDDLTRSMGFVTDQGMGPNKRVGISDPKEEMETRLSREMSDAAAEEKVTQDNDKARIAYSVKWARGYKEFWEGRGEDPHPTTSDDVPPVFRPPYAGTLDLDDATLARMGFNVEPSSKLVGELMNPFRPSTWNIPDFAALVLDPEQLGSMFGAGALYKMAGSGAGMVKTMLSPKKMASKIFSKELPGIVGTGADWAAWNVPGILRGGVGLTKNLALKISTGASAARTEATLMAARGGRGLTGATPEAHIAAENIAFGSSKANKKLAESQLSRMGIRSGLGESLKASMDAESKKLPQYFSKGIDDTGESGSGFVHIRKTHDRVSDTLDPALHANEAGVGEEATTRRIYKDIYTDRAYGYHPKYYAEKGNVDVATRGYSSAYIGRTTGPVLRQDSEIFKKLAGRARSIAKAQGYAPNDETAVYEFALKLAKEEGYGGVDYGEQGIKILKPAKVSPLRDEAMETIANLHNTNKGVTVNFFDKEFIRNGTVKEIKSGYGVGMYRERSLTIDSERLTASAIRKYAMDQAEALSLKGNHLGTEAVNGKTTFDVTKIYERLEDAIRAAQLGKQERIWSYADNFPINVPKGNVATGEAERLLTKAELGSDTFASKLLKGDMDEISRTVGTSGPPGVAGKTSVVPGEVVKGEEQIIGELSSKLRSVINYGRMRTKQALGTYSIVPENIRLKFRRDVGTAVHELGHNLQKQVGKVPTTGETVAASGRKAYVQGRSILGLTMPEHLNELKQIATRGNPGDEGFAEFLSRYVTNDQLARTTCPKFYTFFDNKLELLHPEIRNVLLKAREDYYTLINSSYLSQLHSMTTHFPDDAAKWSLKDTYTAVIDELYPLKKAVDTLVGEGKLAFSKDPAKLMELMKGWDGKADAFFRYGTLNPATLERVGPSLEERLAPVKNLMGKFKDFVILKRGAELMGKHDTGLSPDFITKSMGELAKSTSPDEMLKISRAAEMLTDYNNSLLIYAKDFVGEKNVLKLINMYPDYIPFYHLSPEGWMKGTVGGKGAGLFSPIKRMKGASGAPIVDPIEATIKKTFAVVKAVEENRVRLAMMDMLKQFDGTGLYWREVPKGSYRAAQVTLEEVLDGLPQGMGKFFKDSVKGMDPEAQDIFKMYANIFRGNNLVPKGEPIIPVFKNGEMSLIELNKDLYEVMTKTNADTSGFLGKILSYPARAIKTGATLALEFTAANPIRDNFNAFVNSKYGYVPGFDFVRGLAHMVKKDEVYWAYQIGGGGYSTFISPRKGIQEVYDRVVGGQKWTPRVIGSTPYRALEDLARLGEMGTRLGEGALALKAEAGRGNIEATMRAAHAMRQVSVDFGQIGTQTKMLNQAIPFFNPSLQALNKMSLRFKEAPFVATLKATTAITVPAVGLYLLQKDDPRYKEIDEYWHQSNLVVLAPVKRSDGTYGMMNPTEYDMMTPAEKAKLLSDTVWRIPLSPDLGAIFAYYPIQALRHIDAEYDPHFLGDVASAFMQSFMPPYSLAAVTPMMEIWSNKVLHTGQAIEPEYMRSTLPAEYRAYPYTSEASKKLALGVSNLMHKFGVNAGVSPIVIDHFVRAQFGGLGGTAWKFGSAGLGAIGILPSVKKSPMAGPADLPFISRFAVRFPSATMQSSQDFIDMYETYEQKTNAMKDATKKGAVVSMDQAVAEEERGGQRLRNFYAFRSNPHPSYGVSLTDVKDTIGQVREAMQAVYNNKGGMLSPQQKKDIINEAYFTIAELSKTGISIINSGVDHVDSRPGVPDAEQIGQ